uniref:Metalloendopeptidase n=1 Tax=Timema cristinae TaxID=61476 RepID=A0A7R9H288_TIMCR|nr:unnamed protein product [Timema cristinae]
MLISPQKMLWEVIVETSSKIFLISRISIALVSFEVEKLAWLIYHTSHGNAVLNEDYILKNAVPNEDQLWPDASIIYTINPGIVIAGNVFKMACGWARGGQRLILETKPSHLFTSYLQMSCSRALDGCPSSAQCEMLMKAMRYYHDHTCVRFKEWTGEPNRIDIYFNPDDGACWSMVGRSSLAVQKLSLGYRCWYLGIVLHELGHTIGFWHEMTRFDRDKYIRVLWENIQNGSVDQFSVREKASTLNEPFDYKSIMLYDEFAFTKARIYMLLTNFIPMGSTFLVSQTQMSMFLLQIQLLLFQTYLTHVTELKYDPEDSIELWQTNTNIENWTYVELSIYTPYSFKHIRANLKLPVIGSLLHCESSMLDHAATKQAFCVARHTAAKVVTFSKSLETN